MGELAKKWAAGIAAAVVVVAIVAIAIGRMDRKTTSKGTTLSSVGPKTSSPSSVVPPQSAPIAIPPVASAEGKTAEIQNEVVESAATPKSAAKVGKPRHVVSNRSQPGAQASRLGVSSAAPTQSTIAQEASQPVTQSQPPNAQAPMQASPPDVATQPVQLSTQAETEAQTKQIDLTSNAMKTTGKVDLNGNFTNETALVYANDRIVTPGQNGALVTAEGNAIRLGTHSEFTAQPNSFLLNSGASNVNTATGMAAKIKEYTITPVEPKLSTRYEVNWESDGVYVYARTLDVKIDGPCDFHKTLKQGKAIRIPDPRRCGVMWLNERSWPYAVASAGATGGAIAVYEVTRQPMSGSSP